MHLTWNPVYLVILREPKKQDTVLLPITLPNVDRFWKSFHQRTQQ